MSFVLDASAALALAFRDGDPALAERTEEGLAAGGAVVPQHWPLEVANGLLITFRRRRLSAVSADRARELLLALPVDVDQDTGPFAWSRTFGLAERFGLTVYDAAYLELALRLDAPLATLDQALVRAAREAGARVIT